MLFFPRVLKKDFIEKGDLKSGRILKEKWKEIMGPELTNYETQEPLFQGPSEGVLHGFFNIFGLVSFFFLPDFCALND